MSSLSYLTVSVYQILNSSKFGKSHRTSCVELLGGNAYFCAEAEFSAVCKSGRSVYVDSSCVYLLLEFLSIFKRACYDAL